MCTTCGCGGSEARIDGRPVYRHAGDHRLADDVARAHAHGHFHADRTWHAHPHEHERADASRPPLGAVHAPGTTQARLVQIEQDILAKNDVVAAANRRWFRDRGVFALNLVSSPGSGKTTLLCRTIAEWAGRTSVAVIEGDQQTSFDADRIRATGAPAIQVNTGKGCHLDAPMVARALELLAPAAAGIVFIENVGNLVCPAAFDLGEAHKVVILSVTEGEDKPLKYPDMFRAADLLLVNKIDLAPYVAFDLPKAIDYARRVRPGLEVIEVSATTGSGFAAWLAWLERGLASMRERDAGGTERLEGRLAEIEPRVAAPGQTV